MSTKSTKSTAPPDTWEERAARVSESRHGLERRPLRGWRTLRGRTMFQLAVASGVSVSTIDSLEHARTEPSAKTATALAEALELYEEQLDWLEPVAKPPSKQYARKYAAERAAEPVAAPTTTPQPKRRSRAEREAQS